MTFEYKNPKYKNDPLFSYFKNGLQSSLTEDQKNFISDCAVSACKICDKADEKEILNQLKELKTIGLLSQYPDQDEITVKTLGVCDKEKTKSIYILHNVEKITRGTSYEVLAHEVLHYMSKDSGKISSYLSVNEGCLQIMSANIIDDLEIERLKKDVRPLLLSSSGSTYIESPLQGIGYKRETYLSSAIYDIEGTQNIYDAILNGKKIDMDSQIADICIFLKDMQEKEIRDIDMEYLRMAYIPLYMDKYMKENPSADYFKEYMRKTTEILNGAPTIKIEKDDHTEILIKREAFVPADIIALTKEYSIYTYGSTIESVSADTQEIQHLYLSDVLNVVRQLNIEDFDVKTATFQIANKNDSSYDLYISNKGTIYIAEMKNRFINGEGFLYIEKVGEYPEPKCPFNPESISQGFVLTQPYNPEGFPKRSCNIVESKYYLYLAQLEKDPDKICQYAISNGMKIEDISKNFPQVGKEIKSLDDLSDETILGLIETNKIEFAARNNGCYDLPFSDMSRMLPNGKTILNSMIDQHQNEYAMELLFERISKFAQKPLSEQTNKAWKETMLGCSIDSINGEYQFGLLDMTVSKFKNSTKEKDKELYRKIYEVLLDKEIAICPEELSFANPDYLLSSHNDMAILSTVIKHGYKDAAIFNPENTEGKDLKISLKTLSIIQNPDGSCEYGYLKDGNEFVFGTDPRILELADILKLEKIESWNGVSNHDILKAEIVQDLYSFIPPCQSWVIAETERKNSEFHLIYEALEDGAIIDFGRVPALFAEMYSEEPIKTSGTTYLLKDPEVLQALEEKRAIGRIYDKICNEDKETTEEKENVLEE